MATIVGTGIDLVDVARFRRFLARRPRAAERIFTADELRAGAGAHGHERLAGTFAAKEAALKCLGTGLRRMSWREIEVVRDELGRPRIRASGRAAERARRIGARRFHVSISHLGSFAVAQVVAEGGPHVPAEGVPE